MCRVKSKLLSVFLILSLFVGIVGIVNVDTTYAASKKIHLKKTTIAVTKGYTYQQKLIDKKGKTIKATKVKWKSLKPSIAKISNNGKITAVKVGTAKMTAKYKGKTYKFTVKVKKDEAYIDGKEWLEWFGISKKELIEQLITDGFSKSIAERAVKKLENDGIADWDTECFEAGKDWLDEYASSKQELIKELVDEGFTKDQVENAVQKLESDGIVDWNIECYEYGKEYLREYAYSKQELINDMEDGGFTHEQAENAVQKLEDDGIADWNAECYEYGKEYIMDDAYSKESLLKELVYEGFTHEQAENAVQKLEDDGIADWNAECYEAGKEYLRDDSFSKEELVKELVYDGFTQEQAERAAEKLFS